MPLAGRQHATCRTSCTPASTEFPNSYWLQAAVTARCVSGKSTKPRAVSLKGLYSLQKIYEIQNCHSSWIRDVSWSANSFIGGFLIATASEDKSFKIWEISKKDSESGEFVHTEKCKIVFPSPVWRVKWNYSGNLLAAGFTSTDGINTVQIYHENEKGEWVVISDLKSS